MASYCFRPHQTWTQPVAGELCSPRASRDQTVCWKNERAWSLEPGRRRLGLRLGAGELRHSCEEWDSRREITESCKSHQTGELMADSFTLTEMWIRAGRAAEFRFAVGLVLKKRNSPFLSSSQSVGKPPQIAPMLKAESGLIRSLWLKPDWLPAALLFSECERAHEWIHSGHYRLRRTHTGSTLWYSRK
ncbi:uncharacterized protein V6R79_025719 [Siganus canaliculatus]